MNKLNFSDFDIVLCDSLEALNWAYNNGLSRKVLVKTSSPSLIENNKINTINIEKRWSLHNLKKFQESINEFGKKIFTNIFNIDPQNKEYSLLVAQTVVNFHKIIYKAACLDKSDLKKEILILKIKGKYGNKNLSINSPWDKLLNNNKNIHVQIFETNTKINNITDKNFSNYVSRIRFGGIETLFYRLIIKYLSNFFSKIFTKQALIMGENELIIETMFHMALKGVSLKELKINKIKFEENKNYLTKDLDLYFSKVKKVTYPLLQSRLEDWVEEDLVKPCMDLFFEELLIQFQFMNYFKNIFSKELLSFDDKKNILITSNHVSHRLLALLSICKKMNIPSISFQHGVTPEICDNTKEIAVSLPANNVDRFIVFNDQSALYSKNEAYIKSDSFVSGLPNRYFKTARKIFNVNYNKEILFLSMHLYRGNIGSIKCNYTDSMMLIDELALIKNVLNKLPYKVHYKPYPQENMRYPDTDPILDLLPNYENLIVINERIDARYLLEKYRIIVTTHASSTISWALMSKKPIIFINDKNNSSLSDMAIKAFKKGLFVFESGDVNFYINIVMFLSQNFEVIEKMYIEKEKDRLKLINKYITSYSEGAGKRAANFIYNQYF